MNLERAKSVLTVLLSNDHFREVNFYVLSGALSSVEKLVEESQVQAEQLLDAIHKKMGGVAS